MYSHSRKRNRNGNETTIPEVVFACFAMLSVSLCGTFNRVAVHEDETKKRFIVIYAISQDILSTRHVRQRFPKILSILLNSFWILPSSVYTLGDKLQEIFTDLVNLRIYIIKKKLKIIMKNFVWPIPHLGSLRNIWVLSAKQENLIQTHIQLTKNRPPPPPPTRPKIKILTKLAK